jgi:uncharacterized membrane protein
MQFLYWPLTWGFLLVGVPILVHLINLLRHRRQKWAAMDFLLESYRRNRRWVMLKQWLLLLARMLAMALLVVMLAKWVTSAQWLSWLGGRTTHHYILLDDSASMGAMQPGNESAYDRALRAVNGLVRDIASQPGDHQMTLIRWSRAGLAMRNFEDTSAPGQPDSSAQNTVDLASDLFAQSVPRDPSRLLDRLTATAPTALRLSPETAIESILPSLVNQSSEVPILYLLSDLRRNEFSEVEGLSRQLKQLSDAEVAIHLIDCAEQEDPNLTLASLSPQQEVWAASVPVLVRFSVRNSSSLPARNIVAKVRTVDYPEGEVSPTADQEFSGKANELPPVVIESIEPGQTVTRQFQVVFSAPGQHIVEVTLPEDSLTSDNQRWAVIDIRNSQRVLLVDGDVNQLNAFYFESALQPGERLRTGLTFQKVDPSYLRDVSEEELATYDSVALLDVPRLDPQAVDRLVDYCAAGGGVLMVMGGNTNLAFANEQLYRGGQGLLPVELERIEESPDALLSPKPDTATSQVTATEHPILAPLRNLATNPFFALRIRKQLLPAQRSLEQPGLSIVATGPNQSPLIVDRAIESGRVVAMLTGLSSDWSTWAQDPTFVVFVLRSLGYLGSFRRDPWEAPAGSDLEMTVSDASVLPDGDILFPARNGQRMRMQRPIEFSDSNNVARLRLPVSLLDGLDRSVFDGLLRSGVYESWMMTGDGGYFLQNFAHNVAPEEGQLDRVAHQELQRQFPGVDLQVRSSSSLLGGIGSREATQSNIAMVLLIGLLIVEQVLAYSASYHAQANLGRSQAPPQHVGASR